MSCQARWLLDSRLTFPYPVTEELPVTRSEVALCIENAVTANASCVSTPTALGRRERHAFRVARLIHSTRICSAYLGI